MSGMIRVGIAGLGRAGWNLHARTLAAMPERYQVAAVCDADPDRRAEAQARFDCRAYAEPADLFADGAVDLAVIAMPSHLHAELATRAMRAGKHVLVEKPFATTLTDADRMIGVARETGRLLTGGQNQRYAPDFLKVREIIASGALGRILLIRIAWHSFRRRWDWQTLAEFGGGSLNNDGSHAVDQALLLLDDEEPEVFCQLARTPLSAGDAEDHGKVTLKARHGMVVDVEFTNACAYPQDVWLVMGDRGGLAGSHTRLRWRSVDLEALPRRAVSKEPTLDRSYNREELPWVEESCELEEADRRATHQRLYADLYTAMTTGAAPAITAESIRRQIAVLERCRMMSS